MFDKPPLPLLWKRRGKSYLKNDMTEKTTRMRKRQDYEKTNPSRWEGFVLRIMYWYCQILLSYSVGSSYEFFIGVDTMARHEKQDDSHQGQYHHDGGIELGVCRFEYIAEEREGDVPSHAQLRRWQKARWLPRGGATRTSANWRTSAKHHPILCSRD